MKFFDLCAGIGAGHTAFVNLGWECVGFSEINAKTEKTYRLLNETEGVKNFGDLMKINPSEIPDFDIAVGGFPCQSFSIVGKRKGMGDQRGQVIHGIIKILKAKNIKHFILENVKGLVNHDGGKTMKTILNLLDNAGYDVVWKVLKSSDFGIPQIRERVYFVGTRKDLSWKMSFPENAVKCSPLSKFLTSKEGKYVFNETSQNWKTFEKYLKNKYNKGRFSVQDLLKMDFAIIDTRQSDLRIYNDVCPTLRTGRHGILYVRRGKLRKLSGKEALYLQGFARKQITKTDLVSDTDLLSQAGNAFTVDVIEAVAKHNFLRK